MMRSASNFTATPGVTTLPSCPAPDGCDQDPFGLPRGLIVGAALSASVALPCAPSLWETAA